jgi:hypothetical protein
MKAFKLQIYTIGILLSCPIFAEPKDYQKILMNEPVSLLDFMIYQAQKDLDKHVRRHMLGDIPSFSMVDADYREIFEDLKIEDDDWIHIKQRYALFTPPLRFTRADVDYNFKNGTFDIEVNFRWNWIPQMVIQQKISHKLEETKRNGVLVLNQKTTAKLCERAISDLLGFSIDAITHQGYTNTRLEKIEGKLQQNVLDDMRKKVRIHIDGSLPAGNWTYMTCDTIGHDYPPKINYSYNGNWHALDKIIKRKITK